MSQNDVPPPPTPRDGRGRGGARLSVAAAALVLLTWYTSTFIAACLGVISTLLGALAAGDVRGWRRGVAVGRWSSISYPSWFWHSPVLAATHDGTADREGDVFAD